MARSEGIACSCIFDQESQCSSILGNQRTSSALCHIWRPMINKGFVKLHDYAIRQVAGQNICALWSIFSVVGWACAIISAIQRRLQTFAPWLRDEASMQHPDGTKSSMFVLVRSNSSKARARMPRTCLSQSVSLSNTWCLKKLSS